MFKARVTTVSDIASRYQLKVWPQDAAEPAPWDLDHIIEHIGYKEGSVLLVAHHVAAVFGNVSIQPITPKENLS